MRDDLRKGHNAGESILWIGHGASHGANLDPSLGASEKRVIDSLDDQICEDMAQEMIAAAPADACRVVLQAAITGRGSAVRLTLVSFDSNGGTTGLASQSDLNTRLLRSLGYHREFWISQGRSAWTECTFSVDVPTGNFRMEQR